MTRRLAPGALLSAILVSSGGYALAKPPQSPTAAPADDGKKQGARAVFERGVAHLAEEAWDVALAEFVRSREIYPTKAATRNAAVCLRNLRRYDEALEMIETLVRDFPDLGADDRQFADGSATELKTLVGLLELRGVEPGSTLDVDGRDRGEIKPGSAIRVSAGSRMVRVYKPGFAPFEKRVEVPGEQTVAVEVKMVNLEEARAVPPPKVATTSGEAPPPPSDAPTNAQTIAGFAVGGVGLVGVGVGAVFGLRAMSRKTDSEADGHCVGNLCDPVGTEIRNEGRTSGTISTIAFIAGGVAIGGGVVLLVTAPARRPVHASVGLVPGGVSLRGAW